ncbi:LuxR family transcriptional regulator [Sphingosinicella terrae]|uniref:LuxR family transcriptional regulator n=1 Tax=Sphingosinicella terrae TaxID=2172047 RepID=UPI000E0CC1AC|nr:LuxR family transcriptional regulator [Sphingosinicella terrae]
MASFERAESFLREISLIRSETDLAGALGEVTREMGFHHFALSHHVDVRETAETAIRLHNYPDDWVDYYDRNRLGVSDPVHRASHVTSVGFAWSELPRLIALTPGDHEILARAVAKGIGDGFTIPAHVPGESNGSCSFANPAGIVVPEDALPSAQLVGAFAFEAARRLWRVRAGDREPLPRLTDRQRECIIWVGRGKSDWEISRILGVKEDTVARHVKMARERYGVGKRSFVAIHALFEGSISFHDIFRR